MSLFAGSGNNGTEARSNRLGLPTGTSDPGSAEAGDMYYNTSSNKVRYYDGSAWKALEAPINGIQATGGSVSNYSSGNVYYTVHTFTSPGTFQINSLSQNTALYSNAVDFLVVAGGGAGGKGQNSNDCGGGGGGAGGFRTSAGPSGGGASAETALTATVTTWPISVGPGGANHTVQDTNGNNGTPSYIGPPGAKLIESIGGGGGSGRSGSGQPGGSGGGGSCTGNNSNGTANQGYAGGGPGATPLGATYGGGGAGSAGQPGAPKSGGGGDGGSGVQSSISGTNLWYAGGGGGGKGNGPGDYGVGGNGVGGDGGTNSSGSSATPGSAGTDGRGGGGGGAGGYADVNTTSGAGGNGVVILRYTSRQP